MERRCLRQGAYNGGLNNPGRQLSAEGNAEGQNAQPHQLFRTVRGKGRTVGERTFEVMHGKPGKHGFSGTEDGADRHGGVQGADGDVRFGKKEVFKGFAVELQRFSAQRQTENACDGMNMPAAMGKRMPESIGRIRLAKGNCFSIGAITGAVYSFGCCRISALKTSSRSKLPAVKPGISLMALQRLTLKPVRIWLISCSE